LDALLVPLDESPSAEAALPIAAALASVCGGRLVLVRGPDRPPPGVRPSEVSGSAVSYAEEYLAEHAGRLRAQGLQVETATLPEGPVAQLIIDEAKDRSVDLVVMATHGRSGLGRVVYGGTSNAVLARCPVPVLLARSWLGGSEAAAIQRDAQVMAPQDGSDWARGALPAARELAKALGGALVEYAAPAGAAAGRAIGGTAAGIVVMSTHGRGAPGRQLLGSVADYVLRVGTVPLILVGPAALAGG